MSPEFTKVCRRLILASALAVAAPLATALLLTGTQAAVGDEPEALPAPPSHTTTIAELGHARAVSWISSGHISAR